MLGETGRLESSAGFATKNPKILINLFDSFLNGISYSSIHFAP
jgi:hypothetical protein